MNGVHVAKKETKAEFWGGLIALLAGEAGGLFLGAWLIMLVLGAVLPGLGAGYLLIAGLLFCLSIVVNVSIGSWMRTIQRAIREPHQPATIAAVENVQVSAPSQVDLLRNARQSQATSQTGRR